MEWELINYCLTEDSQLNLENCGCSQGIFAPTIRYHDGTFFMITTNVSGKGNFVVHTKDIRGKWSHPQWIDHEGIDPSLFFDDDGKVYYSGTTQDVWGRQGIAVFEINPFTGERLSEAVIVSYGAGGKHPEAPSPLQAQTAITTLCWPKAGQNTDTWPPFSAAGTPMALTSPARATHPLPTRISPGSPIQANGPC